MGLKFSSEAAGVDMGNTLYSFRKAKSGAKAKEEMKVCEGLGTRLLPLGVTTCAERNGMGKLR
jgi:hypothetical protein